MKLKSFELDPTTSPTRALQRAARAELHGGHWVLVHQPGGFEVAVHDFRRSMKRVRALLRLARPALGKSYKKHNAALRDAARGLSTLRDRTALPETLEKLRKCGGDEERRAVATASALFDGQRESIFSSTQREEHISSALLQTQQVISEVERWQIRYLEDLSDGFARTYSRGRQLMKEVTKGNREQLHEWRKYTKYQRYQLRLLRPLYRSVLSGERNAAKRLSDLLGYDHDLEILGEHLDKLSDEELSQQHRKILSTLIQSQRQSTQGHALKLGQLFFAEKPKSRKKRVLRYLRTTYSSPSHHLESPRG